MSTVVKIPHEIHTAPAYDVQKVRKDFPVLQQSVHGKPLVYLDNAATTPIALTSAPTTSLRMSASPRESDG